MRFMRDAVSVIEILWLEGLDIWNDNVGVTHERA